MSSQISRLFFSFLIVCFANSTQAEFADIQRLYRLAPNKHQFEICQSGGCAKVSNIVFNNDDWATIESLFNEPAQNAAAERISIAKAIGLFEQVVGPKAGTSGDLAGTFNNAYGQQDCNDEAINTTTYMRLLKSAGYMALHEIEDLRTRNFFFTGWPHTTAVIHEIATGERFAVDSWFYDNGHPATIVPFNIWKANYQPEDSPIGQPRNDE